MMRNPSDIDLHLTSVSYWISSWLDAVLIDKPAWLSLLMLISFHLWQLLCPDSEQQQQRNIVLPVCSI